MLKKWTMSFFLLILLSGCSSITGKNDFYEKINSIEQALNDPDWKQLKSLGNELDQLYQGSQWKIQLMGDEDEYESLQESINHLIVAIEEQDLTETKLEVATIKTFIEDIFTL
ncbi:hypothetical protein DOE78_02335 [Bacillus sp. Y1]|nr:DUF4363 family protein [Bacillus sp. Y1]AYA74379.1 hypothetical protein DOE78_02335 [Bacillus sp. Y1]